MYKAKNSQSSQNYLENKAKSSQNVLSQKYEKVARNTKLTKLIVVKIATMFIGQKY